MQPSVTVVIPAYNVEKYIGDAIRSVLAQSIDDWQCVVVDDGSRDGTVAEIEKFDDPRVRLVRQQNAGVSVARNTGLAAAEAESVLFLDGDDMLHPTGLERLVKALAAAPDAILVYGTSMRVTPDGVVQPGQKPPQDHVYISGEINKAMLTHGRVFWNGGQMLARVSAVRSIGGYTPGILMSQDWEMFCRLTAVGAGVFIGPQEEILRHRVHPESTSPTRSLDFNNHLPAIEAVFGNESLKARFTPAEWTSMHEEVLAAHQFEAGRQNFMQRRFSTARTLMFKGLMRRPTKRRAAVFVLAQASQVLNRPLVGILQFNVAKAPKDAT